MKAIVQQEFGDAAEAHQLIESRNYEGKVLLKV